MRENGCHCTCVTCSKSPISMSAGLCLLAYSGSGGIMVWVVSEHSSCAVTGTFSTAFRHLALMMFCRPYGQLGVFFFPFSLSCSSSSSRSNQPPNSKKHASSAGLLRLGLTQVKIVMCALKRKDVLAIPMMFCPCTYDILVNHIKCFYLLYTLKSKLMGPILTI